MEAGEAAIGVIAGQGVMSNDFCVSPTDIELTANNRNIFHHVLRNVSGERVLDLGCGSISHYWAMGYVDRVAEIVSVDINPGSVEALRTALNTLAPEVIGELHGATLEWLADNGLTEDADPARIALRLLESMTTQTTADFNQSLEHLGNFDTVLALESLECVDSEEQLVTVLQNVAAVLTPGGRLVGLLTPYEENRGYVEEFINRGVEGRLNPNRETLQRAFAAAGFNLTVTSFATGIDNYGTSLVLDAHR